MSTPYVRVNDSGETHYVNLALVESVGFIPATPEKAAHVRIDFTSDNWEITDQASMSRLRDTCEALVSAAMPRYLLEVPNDR